MEDIDAEVHKLRADMLSRKCDEQQREIRDLKRRLARMVRAFRRKKTDGVA